MDVDESSERRLRPTCHRCSQGTRFEGGKKGYSMCSLPELQASYELYGPKLCCISS